ncbi:type I-E CRISPR-associated protein Cas7/Cse4/CasC [Paucibacter sp. XJ19-41]|uniref:type I-E CRISPR-associated protein Cas7/Cse4/CasC n=1 Tax=Paucibacter sp. XJ19-41 TaxID=2927824 RepID=UPI00234A30B5|nr:type I-E CRISPR-associated protein Cas7/Cse4/CasC [Paucibacter sp. XJ19-41]MDC6166471.1 type I-E CRISPR-associated protein Cas7/Cse4/CasC [Paucibacter sp. XJ19-41]
MINLPRFIQIHTLHTYPGALLNRDDAGLAKRLPYGNAIRTRISSQCLKRHWRVAEDRFALAALGVPMAVRSRQTLELIRKELLAQGVAENLAQACAEGLRSAGLLDKPKEAKGKEALETGQAVLLGRAEIDYLVKRCANLASDCSEEKDLKAAIAAFLKDEKKNIEALKHGSGLESALFGRMVTSDVLANRDAAVYVAHAFTVHEAQVENDYFTVVDDLQREAGETGSAGIFDTELSSGLYYGYVVVDVPQLIANLEGEAAANWAALGADKRELSGRVVQHLLHLIATVSPGAKRGSTAPFEWAKFMLVEAGDWQPRSLAGTFQNALPLTGSDLRGAAVQRLSEEIGKLDDAYGAPLARRFLAVDDVAVPGASRLPLAALGEWVKTAITQADAPLESC